MTILRGLWAAARFGWWRFVLWTAPRDWPGKIDAIWFLYRAREDLNQYLEGK